MRPLVLILVLTAASPYLAAQRMASAPRFAAGAHHRASYYPSGFFSDGLYSDLLNSGYPVASQPPIFFLQPPPVREALPVRPPTPTQPLMIELQGDHYVRISGEENSGAEIIEHSSSAINTEAVDTYKVDTQKTLAKLDPVTLIFRDGHKEQVSDYTIAEGILYARGNYYTDGWWTKKIELSSLNLRETIASNKSLGIDFRLPAASNEVITRP
jgi:hypothetical protein